MIDAELRQYEAMFGPNDSQVQQVMRAAARSDRAARIGKSVLRARLRNSHRDPHAGDNPFLSALPASALGGDGVVVGTVDGGDENLVWRFDEIAYSLLSVGSPGTGKTTGIIHLIGQLAPHYTIIVPDVRGDFEALCRAIPGARLFLFGHFPVNLLQAPRRVPPNIYAGRFSQVFTDRFDLQQSSRRYIAMVLDDLYARCEAPGHWPCLPDLRDALQDRKEPRGSDELRFRNRCLARIDTLCRALGDESIGVEQGIDLEGLTESRSTLIFRLEQEQTIQDFLVNWLIMYIYEYRTWGDRKFDQDPILIVLDEQRSLLSQRR